MRKRLGLSAMLVLLVGVARVQAQGVLVLDLQNLAQNAISAVQEVLIQIQTVLIEANQILDLTSLDDIGTAGGIAEDMKLLALLVEQANGLSYDISSLEAQIAALFDLDTAPETTGGLKERLAEIRRIKWQCYGYAMRVQTLLKTAARTAEHLVQLLDTIGALIGNKQGHQTHMQATTVASKHLANIDINIAAFNRAQSVDKLEEVLTIEAFRRINNRVFERDD